MPTPALDTIDTLRLVEHLHGHLGWLAAISLVHPAILLRNRKRRAHLAVALSLILVTVVFGVGCFMYDPYRDKVKQQIFLHAPRIGFLFERKEHLAFGVLVLAWGGAIAYAAARTADGTIQESLRTFAFRAFALAAVLALATAALGTIVASYRTF